MKNLVLIGMMGCGKSTVGALLAQQLGWELVDTDLLIEEREGHTIPEIFASRGESYFREREREVALELSKRENTVIACGGGLPLRTDCITPLKTGGKVIFLHRDPGEIYDTVSMAGRPLGQGGRADFCARFAQREPIYRRWADLVVEQFDSPQEAAERILEGVE